MPNATDPSPPHPLVAGNLAALEGALVVLDGLPEGAFADRTEAAFSASPGEHFRHVIEHYRMFLDGWRNGLVDYDSRPRNLRLERDAPAARAAIEDLCAALRALPTDANADPARPLTVRCATGTQLGAGSPTSSTVGRELVFLHSHSVHHFAFVAIILKHRSIAVAGDFGVAPATLSAARLRAGAG